MAKVTWEQYRSLHHIVSEEEFDIAEAIAENEVQRVIGIIR
mgnify:FL=1